MKTQIAALILAGLACAASVRAGSGPDYTMHEWGTFTSVQAPNGEQLPWNPLSVAELPHFVYSLAWPQGYGIGKQNIWAAKTAFQALQRMETPVIYFYADAPQTVDVSVGFPNGKITEWYPQAAKANAVNQNDLKPSGGKIAWNGVRLLPRDAKAEFPQEPAGSHYYAARETDANPLQVAASQGTQTEKFLFYRGVGDFAAPLTVTQQGDEGETLALKNTGFEPLKSLFAYRIQDGRAVWTKLPELAPGEERAIRLQGGNRNSSAAEFSAAVGKDLERGLIAEGLFPREAQAMVKTWEESWFSEAGFRVLYLIPSSWTDRFLPLQMDPPPAKRVRVMLGRVELLTRNAEFALLQEMIRYAEGNADQKSAALAKTRELGLGRFAEPAVRHLLAKGGTPLRFQNSAWEMLAELNKAEAKAKRVAAR